MRRRLAVVALAVSSLVAVAFAVPLALLVRDVARDRALTAAERDAAALAPVLAATDDVALLESAVRQTGSGGGGDLVVVLPDGRAVGDRSPPDEDGLAVAAGRAQAFSVATGAGVDVYVPVVTGTGTAVVVAHVPDGELSSGVVPAWSALGGVALVLVAGAVAVADRLARGVTRPASALASTARRLAEGDLDARAAHAGPPELVEVSAAFNDMAERIRDLLAAERERVADLSHRLRTPLTALRLAAEARRDSDLLADVDRLTSAVNDTIGEARRPLRDAPRSSDLVAVVRARVEFWGALADDQGRPWSLTVDPTTAPVRATAGDLEAALDSLLGNVFSHTPEGTACAVTVSAAGTQFVVDVDDAGPGIGDPASVLRRGASGSGSTGLGLDIARRVAEDAGGGLEIAPSPLGGARVRLCLRAEDAA